MRTICNINWDANKSSKNRDLSVNFLIYDRIENDLIVSLTTKLQTNT